MRAARSKVRKPINYDAREAVVRQKPDTFGVGAAAGSVQKACDASSSQKEEALQVLAGALGPGRGKFRLEQSFTWGCVSLKHHKRGGLQVDCPRRSHIRHHHKSGKRMLCTYSSNYKTEEQRHEAVQRMKWWIIRGLEESCRSHSAHQEIKKQVQKAPLSALPSDQELDAQMPPAERALTDDEGKKPRQANRPKKQAKAAAKASTTVIAAEPKKEASSDSDSDSDSGSGSGCLHLPVLDRLPTKTKGSGQ